MKTFVLNEKEISMTTEWNELSLGQYINFMKLNERREKEEMVQDFYLLSLMEVLCKVNENELDDLSLAEYQENLEAMKFLLDTPTVEDTDVIEIDGVKYCLPQKFDSLSAGEYISIKTLQSRYENNIEGLPYLEIETIGKATLRLRVNMVLAVGVNYASNAAALDNLEQLITSVLTNLPSGYIVGEVNRPTVTQVGSANQLVADIRVSTYFQK